MNKTSNEPVTAQASLESLIEDIMEIHEIEQAELAPKQHRLLQKISSGTSGFNR